jgi:hypothetical protein
VACGWRDPAEDVAAHWSRTNDKPVWLSAVRLRPREGRLNVFERFDPSRTALLDLLAKTGRLAAE